MTIGRDLLTKAETVTIAAIESGAPTLVEAREIIAEFHLMVRRKVEAGFAPWIERARASLVAPGDLAGGTVVRGARCLAGWILCVANTAAQSR